MGSKRPLLSAKQIIGLLLLALLLSTGETGIPTVANVLVAISTPSSPTGITVSVAASGTYTIRSRTPAWTFGGDIGQALTDITVHRGSDNIGSYQEIVFNYQAASSRSGSIRVYDSKPIVLFTDKYLSTSSNSAPFPHLTTYPRNLYHFGYTGQFARYSFTSLASDSPWLFYDHNEHAFIFSPASSFMVASIRREQDGSIASGIDTAITTLPAGFTHKTFLVIEQGINNVYETWGHAMTDLQGKIRPPNDVDTTLNYLGYWTDTGAAYYYRFDPSIGYIATLLAVRDSFRRQGIPLGYMELDSWFYPKGSSDTWQGDAINDRGGIFIYRAAPDIFPNGLKAFQQQLGLPLMTHARWIDPSSPYRQQFTMSNNVSTDPRFWHQLAGYLKDAGVIGFKQDWLDKRALPATNLSDPLAFMNNMASALATNGITMQYCMPLPRHFLQSSIYNNLTTIRVSPDHFQRSRWDRFLYTSRLAAALGVWPWADVFMSTETDNLLLATLSAGIVGVGDSVGSESKANLFQSVRADGVIVKPDVPIVPIDDIYLTDAQGLDNPMVASTYTDHGGMKALYVFAYKRGDNMTATFKPTSLGFTSKVYVYNYYTGTGKVVEAGSTYSDTVADAAYYIVVPIGQSGIAFLGDAGKFVSLGKKRIPQLLDNGNVQATITFASGETALTMLGYSPSLPQVTVLKGTVGHVAYDSSTHLFKFVVSPAPDDSATIVIGQSNS